MQDTLTQLYPWMHLVGRVLFSFVFVVHGLGQLTHVTGTAANAASRGVRGGRAWAIVTGLALAAGGTLVALGWHRFIGAGLLVIFPLLTAFLTHGFWRENDPVVRANERMHFTKDLALAGAALFIAVYAGTSWPMSLGG